MRHCERCDAEMPDYEVCGICEACDHELYNTSKVMVDEQGNYIGTKVETVEDVIEGEVINAEQE